MLPRFLAEVLYIGLNLFSPKYLREKDSRDLTPQLYEAAGLESVLPMFPSWDDLVF